MNDIDMSVDGFEVPEILVSNISGDQLGILRQVKSDEGRHANHSVAEPDRLVAGLIRRMNDQQPTVSPELLVQRANHRSIERGDSIRLVPTINRDQHQACGLCVAVVHAPVPRARGRRAGAMHRVTHAAVVSA